jgi:putative MATE family efflux protein
MVANFLQTLTVTVDLAMVGSLDGIAPTAVASVGLGGQFLFLFFSVMIAVSSGTIALVARAVGAGDRDGADRVLKQSLVLAALLSVPLLLVGVAAAEPILTAFRAEPDVVRLGTAYTQVVSLSVFFQFVSFLGAAALRGAGDTVTPLWIGAAVNVVNIVANVNLIFGNALVPRLEVVGAAIGTSLSFAFGAAVYVVLFLRGRSRLRLALRPPWIDRAMTRRIFRIGWPAALEQILFQIAFLVWVTMVIAFGTEALAAHQIGFRIQMFAFMPGFGFAIAATALVGQNLGARRPADAERRAWEAAKWSVGVMGAIALAIYVFAEGIATLFIRDPEVVGLSVTWIRIHALSIPAVGVFFAIDGSLRGAGDTRFPLLTSASGMYGVRLPLAFVLGFVARWGIVGVWIPLVIEYWYRSAVITTYFRRGRWKSFRV